MDVIESIASLDLLINKLEKSSLEDFPSILKNISINPNDFNKYKSWKGDGYSRNCIIRSKNFELILLCWNEGDKTPIHNHDGQKCWVYQVEGTVDEVRYQMDDHENPVEIYRHHLIAGSLSYMEDRMGYHVLENTSDGRASTLHIYMLPIERCEYYCEDTEGLKERELIYDTKHN